MTPPNTPPNNQPTPDTAAAEEALVIRTILVPLDFSQRARKALRHARALARQHGATLILLHVVEPLACPSDLGYTPVISEEMMQEIHQDAARRLEEAAEAERRLGLSCRTVLRSGRPYIEIAEAAAELKADLVVLTTHGYTGLKHVLLGSTAERVIRHAPCPVLVVRDPETGEHPSETPEAGGG